MDDDELVLDISEDSSTAGETDAEDMPPITERQMASVAKRYNLPNPSQEEVAEYLAIEEELDRARWSDEDVKAKEAQPATNRHHLQFLADMDKKPDEAGEKTVELGANGKDDGVVTTRRAWMDAMENFGRRALPRKNGNDDCLVTNRHYTDLTGPSMDRPVDGVTLHGLATALFRDGLARREAHYAFDAILRGGVTNEVVAYMKSTRYNDAKLDQGPRPAPGPDRRISSVNCYQLPTVYRPLPDNRHNGVNMCSSNTSGLSQCKLCLSVVCAHHAVCDHSTPALCPSACRCRDCKDEQRNGFTRKFLPIRAAPVFAGPVTGHWKKGFIDALLDNTNCDAYLLKRIYGSADMVHGENRARAYIHLQRAKYSQGTHKSPHTTWMIDTMEWRYVSGPSTEGLFGALNHEEEKASEYLLTWINKDRHGEYPAGEWVFTTESWTILNSDFKMPTTWAQFYSDPDAWLKDMVVDFSPTKRRTYRDEYVMFLRLQFLLNQTERHDMERAMDMFRAFMFDSLTGGLFAERGRTTRCHQPIQPAKLEMLRDNFKTIMEYLWVPRNSREYTPRVDGQPCPILDPVLRPSAFLFFVPPRAEVEKRVKAEFSRALVQARAYTVNLYLDPYMSTKGKTKGWRHFLKRFGKWNQFEPKIVDKGQIPSTWNLPYDG
jgi:hypothetical protein